MHISGGNVTDYDWQRVGTEYNISDRHMICVLTELKNEKILDITMIGNEGVLTYLNQTTRGQSGGPVIQDLIGDTSNLVAIHVSGYLEQSNLPRQFFHKIFLSERL